MKVGTKSVLYGAHCFFIHPFFVAAAWWKLFGFPWNPRLWVAFFVHDLGYWGKPNMDGPEGETHVELGSDIMFWLFDAPRIAFRKDIDNLPDEELFRWGNFSKYHSRFYAKRDGAKPSKLCFADKLAMCLEPDWFYLLRVNWSGEIKEYMHMADVRNLAGEHKTAKEAAQLSTKSQKEWRKAVKSYVSRWVNEHVDGREDTWTPDVKKSINPEGVWQ